MVFLTDAKIAMLLSHTLVTLLVRSAFRVYLILWRTNSHFGHWSIPKQEAVAAISPVLSLVKFFRAIFFPELFCDR